MMAANSASVFAPAARRESALQIGERDQQLARGPRAELEGLEPVATRPARGCRLGRARSRSRSSGSPRPRAPRRPGSSRRVRTNAGAMPIARSIACAASRAPEVGVEQRRLGEVRLEARRRRPRARASRSRRSSTGPMLGGALAGREPQRDGARATCRHERARLAVARLVDVERRVAPVALVELGRRARRSLAAADLGEHLGCPAAGAPTRSRSASAGGTTPARSSSRTRPSGPGTTCGQHLVQRVRRVQRRCRRRRRSAGRAAGAHVDLRHARSRAGRR